MDTTIQIEHRADRSRFEATVDGLTCELDYRLANGTMAITHTGVPRPLEGRGIAGRMTHAALAYAEANGLKVAPHCSYAAAYMKRHPETAALLAS